MTSCKKLLCAWISLTYFVNPCLSAPNGISTISTPASESTPNSNSDVTRTSAISGTSSYLSVEELTKVENKYHEILYEQGITDPTKDEKQLARRLAMESVVHERTKQEKHDALKDKNSSSYILRQIMVPLSIRQKVYKIENRHLTIKGIIPPGQSYMDEDVDVLKRKYRWHEMIKRCSTSDIYIQKIDEYLTAYYNEMRKCLEETLIKQKCEERENSLNKKLDEIKEFGRSMKENNETSQDMLNRLLVMKTEYKEILKNFNETCTKTNKRLENLTYDNVILDFSHSLAYCVENTSDIVAHIEQMGLEAKKSLKLFDNAIDPYVTIFYNAVISSEGAQPPIPIN